jgi:ABC-2 type transport system ATP-binding protein
MADDIALSVNGLSKDFVLPHERKNTLKEFLLHFNKPTFERQNALHDINFEVKRGEFFGIVGRNGSGKSTLLKLIGGIYQPTVGSVTVNGTLTPFIELGIGFNPELTGRENVYLNGAILGLTRKEIIVKYDEIVAFAEIERFMDQKLKNYSSGMQVRLAFSIAMQAHNDILLIDEVLAVGDANFQRKCFQVFNDIKKEGKKTVVFVTHDMGAVQKFCDRAMMIQDSRVIEIGDPRKIALRYELANTNVEANRAGSSVRPENPVVKKKIMRVKCGVEASQNVSLKDTITIEVDFTVREATQIQINLFLVTPDGRYLAGINTTKYLKQYTPGPGKHTITCELPAAQFAKGSYQVNAALYTYSELYDIDAPELIDILDTTYGADTPKFEIMEDGPNTSGEFNMRGAWSNA